MVSEVGVEVWENERLVLSTAHDDLEHGLDMATLELKHAADSAASGVSCKVVVYFWSEG